jgi:DNA replication protein DnaC
MDPRTTAASTDTAGQSLQAVVSRIASDPDRLALLAEREVASKRRELEGRRNALAAHLGRRYWPEAVTLATFERYDKAQDVALKQLQAFLAGLPEKIEAGEGLVLAGEVGTGKDRLLAVALYAACATHKVEYRSGQDLFGLFRDRMDQGAAEEQGIRDLFAPDVLALSDPVPPAGALSAWRLELLYRVVDRRYRDRRPTWVTINATGSADAEAKLGSQVWDRLQEGATVIPCRWTSYRERKRA